MSEKRTVRMAKVYNDGVVDWEHKVRGEPITIKVGECIDVPYRKALAIRGTYTGRHQGPPITKEDIENNYEARNEAAKESRLRIVPYEIHKEGETVIDAVDHRTGQPSEFICPKCDKVCGSKAGLMAHLRKCINDDTSTDSTEHTESAS